jgi:hypothetical protein
MDPRLGQLIDELTDKIQAGKSVEIEDIDVEMNVVLKAQHFFTIFVDSPCGTHQDTKWIAAQGGQAESG